MFLKVCNEHLQYLCVYTYTQMHTAGRGGGREEKRGRDRERGDREGEDGEGKKGQKLLCPDVYLRHGSVYPLLDVLHSVIWQCYFEHEAYGRGQTTGLWLSLPC